MKKRTLLLVALCLIAVTAAGSRIEDLKREMESKTGAGRQAAASGLAKALAALGDEEQKRQDYRAALAAYAEALSILRKFPDLDPSPHLLTNTGLVKLIMGDYDGALEVLLQALTAAEDSGTRTYITQSAFLIGYAHRDLGNYDLSLKHFQLAHDTAQSRNDAHYAIMALNEIGNVHVYQKHFEEALPFKKRSLRLAREYKKPTVLATCLHDMGNLYLSQDQPDRALPYFRESLAILRGEKKEREIIITLLNMADCDRRLGRFSAALARLDEARSLSEKLGLDKILSDVLSMYSQVHEDQNDHRRALDYQRRYHELWQRLFDEEKAKQTAEMQTRYEVEKKQRENELLRREKEIAALATARQRSQRNFLFFVALLVLLLAAVLYYNFRAKARANLWLEEANRRISAQQGKLEKAYRQMEDLARRDQLTGLPNRRAALEEIEREEKRFQRSQKPFTLVMADLDGFKAVNDSLGHDAGDFVLKAAAALFSGSLRAQDMVARWGGDEFLFLLPETDAPGARVLCQTVGEKVSGHDFEFNGRHLKVAVSLGAGTFRPGGTIEECLHEADQAMYRSRDGAASLQADAPGS